MIPILGGAEDAQLKKEYLDTLASFKKASDSLQDTSQYRNTIKDLETKLSKKGYSDFVTGVKNKDAAMQRFFGELGLTGRGKAFAIAQNFSSILGNFQNIIQTDLFEAVTGIGREKAKRGEKQNDFMARLFGANKYQEKIQPVTPDVPQNIPSDLPSNLPTDPIHTESLLENIETNTRQLSQSFEIFTGLNKRQLADEKRRRVEESREGLKGNSSVSPKSLSNKASGFVGDIFDSFLGAGFGASIGAALAPLLNFGKIALRAVPIIGSVLSIGFDSFKGYNWANELGVDKFSGTVGAILGGTNKGLVNIFSNMGKWALTGAAIGSVVPVVGTIAGGLIGGALGAVLGWVGGETIARFFSDAGENLSNFTDTAITQLNQWFDNTVLNPFNQMVDMVFGTSFAADTSHLENTLYQTNEKIIQREAELKEVSDKIKALTQQLDQANAAGNTQLAESLRNKILVLKDTAAILRQDIDRRKEEADKIKTDLSQAQSGILSSMSDWVEISVLSPMAAVTDLILGTDFSDDETREKISSEVSRVISNMSEFVAKTADNLIDNVLPNFLMNIGDFISKIFTYDYWFGNVEDQSNGIRQRLEQTKQAEMKRAEIVALLDNYTPSGNTNLREALSQFKKGDIDFSALQTAYRKAPSSFGISKSKSALEDYRVFLDNFKGNVDIANQAVSARKAFIRNLRKSIDTGLFDDDSKFITDAFRKFEQGSITLPQLKEHLVMSTFSSDSNTKLEAGLALEQFGAYENRIQSIQKLQPTPVSTNLGQANDEYHIARDKIRGREAQSVVGITNNNQQTLNNNTTVTLPPSPNNNEPTFAGSLGGHTSTTFTGY